MILLIKEIILNQDCKNSRK